MPAGWWARVELFRVLGRARISERSPRPQARERASMPRCERGQGAGMGHTSRCAGHARRHAEEQSSMRAFREGLVSPTTWIEVSRRRPHIDPEVVAEVRSAQAFPRSRVSVPDVGGDRAGSVTRHRTPLLLRASSSAPAARAEPVMVVSTTCTGRHRLAPVFATSSRVPPTRPSPIFPTATRPGRGDALSQLLRLHREANVTRLACTPGPPTFL